MDTSVNEKTSTTSEEKALSGKCIVLGVTGSIAAYKAPELVRRLTAEGAKVHVALTRGGEQFVTAVTLRTLSGHPVVTDMFVEPANWDVLHVSLAQRATRCWWRRRVRTRGQAGARSGGRVAVHGGAGHPARRCCLRRR